LAALNALLHGRGDPGDALRVLKWCEATLNREDMLARWAGFLGGEALEITRWLCSGPFATHESDSGLDIDALRLVADGVNAALAHARCMITIISAAHASFGSRPSSVNGRIVKSGGAISRSSLKPAAMSASWSPMTALAKQSVKQDAFGAVYTKSSRRGLPGWTRRRRA
jgi:Fe-S cluster assembly ATPase SufC